MLVHVTFCGLEVLLASDLFEGSVQVSEATNAEDSALELRANLCENAGSLIVLVSAVVERPVTVPAQSERFTCVSEFDLGASCDAGAATWVDGDGG